MISINLPNNKFLKCQSTGKRKKIKLLKSADLFMFNSQIFERWPGTSLNLSDLDDIREPDENEYVEVYEEIK